MNIFRTSALTLLGVALFSTACDPVVDDELRSEGDVSSDSPDDQASTDHEGEPCDELEETIECGDGQHNVCDLFDDERRWGPCHTLECEPGDRWECGELGVAWCEVDGGMTVFGECEEGTPLVLSFDGAEPTMMTSAAASFDVGTGGVCIQTDWPTATTPWLALDRDGSGSIDGGHELFGSGTVLRSGARARHGFSALAELDSNGDGRISAADARWDDLVLWSDVDADKRSTPGEHLPLSARGILSIELDWSRDVVCDARGNCGVERASFEFIGAGGAVSQGQVVDVHLSCQ
ncbi:MAG: calcium-binding protein [Myxococcota bacterium]